MIPQDKSLPTTIVFSVFYRVHPDDRQKFIDAVLPQLETEAAIPGCVYYNFAQDLADPNTFHLSEGWRDQAALDEHDESAPFLRAVEEVMTNVRILEFQGQRYEVAPGAQSAGTPPGGATAAD